MTADSWDYLALAGVAALAIGMWLTYGLGPMLIVLGALLLIAGIGGAANPMRR
jgi:hypothetical protein